MGVEEHVTTALDALALLLLAAGVLCGLWPLIAGWSIACGGGVVFLGVRVIDGGTGRFLARFRKGSP
jgi:hypothetical protein